MPAGSRPGERRGGRQKGSTNKTKKDTREIFLAHGPEAVQTIIDLMKNSRHDNVRLGAANSLLDRAYGKPTQPISGDNDADPITTNFVVSWKKS